MTALFVVIFVEQWYNYRTHLPAIIGLICGIGSLLIFGPSNFILPALIVTVFLLIVLRGKIENKTITEVDNDA
jgi:4-azaleucine resistance transporter AzlC